MSQHHATDADGSNTNPIKLAVAIAVGALIMIVGIMLLASYAIGSYSPGTDANINTPEAIAERIAPVTKLTVDASKGSVPALSSAPAAAPLAAAAPIVAMAIPAALPAGAAAAKPLGGKGIFDTTCTACHAAGLAGAPKAGDKAAWSPRIAQGVTTLYEHALKGYTGKAGIMLPKGGNPTLADADVKAAVDYMVSLAK